MSDYLRPILLTGLPRTGTTWASRAVAAATRSRVAHEPFNWKLHPDRVGYHMKYMLAGSKDVTLLELLHSAMKPKFPFLSRFRRSRRVLIKDVHICLAIEYLWEQLRPLIIILVRHPCAMASSWSNLGLEARSRLDLLLAQRRLMQDHLAPFESHMNSEDDYFFEIGAYWGASYYVLSRLAEKHEDWQWVTHEALCVQSLTRFEQLLNDLGMELEGAGRSALCDFLDKHNRERKKKEGAYALARVSVNEPDKWRSALAAEQIRAVTKGAEPFGLLPKFYSGKYT